MRGARGNFGSREELDAATNKAKQESNFNTRTRQTKAGAMLARMQQDRPPGTML